MGDLLGSGSILKIRHEDVQPTGNWTKVSSKKDLAFSKE